MCPGGVGDFSKKNSKFKVRIKDVEIGVNYEKNLLGSED
jgi:hypothetical protein